jgi:hypothetical protein
MPRNIKLEKNAGLLLLVEIPSHLLHKHEVVLDKALFDES